MANLQTQQKAPPRPDLGATAKAALPVDPPKQGRILDRSIGALRILVSGEVEEIKKTGKKGDYTIFERPAIISGGKRDLLWTVSAFDDKTKILGEGVYVFSNDCLTMDKWDNLSLNTYPEAFVFVRDLTPDEKKRFVVQKTTQDDIL